MDTHPVANKEEQRRKAEQFRGLHRGARILVLPNAWDAASAKVFERAGFPAVATTSAGIANAYGYPDGEVMPRAEMLEAVGRIARAVALPVTADMEMGFGHTPDEIAETARLTLEAGAVGLNLEDGTRDESRPLADLALQVERIRAVRQAAEQFGVPLVINARTDVYLRLDRQDPTRLAQAIERGNAYRAAGADCIFAFGVGDRQTIAALVREIAAPINILAHYGGPTIAELEELGVARVTFGSTPMRATMSLVGRIAEELKQAGTYSFGQGVVSYAEVNSYFEH
ncbi:MAG: Carboxyvinyl-carboxyphosphonate phosphorylmutase [Chloroflexi bacterium ADurb.Bin325]|nr:MAG: Carboxyvinyl-carboxyphosphonate phosphorylmutase [Chloroflexi bacterium ADurb.Bin325]